MLMIACFQNLRTVPSATMWGVRGSLKSGVMEFLLVGLVDFVDTADYNYFVCSFRYRRILHISFYDMNNNNVCVRDVFIILLSSSLITSVSVLNNQIPKTKPPIH